MKPVSSQSRQTVRRFTSSGSFHVEHAGRLFSNAPVARRQNVINSATGTSSVSAKRQMLSNAMFRCPRSTPPR